MEGEEIVEKEERKICNLQFSHTPPTVNCNFLIILTLCHHYASAAAWPMTTWVHSSPDLPPRNHHPISSPEERRADGQ